MTLAEYLASEAAREDVRRLLSEPRPCVKPGDPVGWRHYGVQAMPYPAPPSVWCGISADWGGSMLPVPEWQAITVYYRPDGERYTVTDLGGGVKALRLKGVALLDIRHRVDEVMARMYCDGLLHAKYGPAALIQAEIGTLDYVFAADLPDAICRVMLASLRVAQS